MSGELAREVQRKLFHLLGLVYLGFYYRLGTPRILWVLGAWIAVEGAVEAARLRSPRLNGFLMGLFSTIHREKEMRRVSGIFWASLGCWAVFWMFGARPRLVTAAVANLIFGDLFAAIVGKWLGRIPLGSRRHPKTVEGSLTCFLVCGLCGLAAGLRGMQPWFGAAVATLLELWPLPPDDNLWLPIGSALALSLWSK